MEAELKASSYNRLQEAAVKVSHRHRAEWANPLANTLAVPRGGTPGRRGWTVRLGFRRRHRAGELLWRPSVFSTATLLGRVAWTGQGPRGEGTEKDPCHWDDPLKINIVAVTLLISERVMHHGRRGKGVVFEKSTPHMRSAYGGEDCLRISARQFPPQSRFTISLRWW